MASSVKQISAPELKVMIDAGDPFEFVDVRTDWERDIATIDGARSIVLSRKPAPG